MKHLLLLALLAVGMAAHAQHMPYIKFAPIDTNSKYVSIMFDSTTGRIAIRGDTVKAVRMVVQQLQNQSRLYAATLAEAMQYVNSKGVITNKPKFRAAINKLQRLLQ